MPMPPPSLASPVYITSGILFVLSYGYIYTRICCLWGERCLERRHADNSAARDRCVSGILRVNP